MAADYLADVKETDHNTKSGYLGTVIKQSTEQTETVKSCDITNVIIFFLEGNMTVYTKFVNQ